MNITFVFVGLFTLFGGTAAIFEDCIFQSNSWCGGGPLWGCGLLGPGFRIIGPLVSSKDEAEGLIKEVTTKYGVLNPVICPLTGRCPTFGFVALCCRSPRQYC
ncbi:unnamed protein product, partial [Mesorhabditis spiculigera]